MDPLTPDEMRRCKYDTGLTTRQIRCLNRFGYQIGKAAPPAPMPAQAPMPVVPVDPVTPSAQHSAEPPAE